MKGLTTLVSVLMLIGLYGCEDSKGLAGKPGEVLIVMNEADWESPLGAMVRESMTDDYPMLPQAEPRFKLSNVEHASFGDILLDFRNIVIFETNSKYSSKVSYRKNVWAPQQFVVNVRAESYAKAIELYKNNADEINKKIEEAERERIISNNEKYSAPKVMHEVSKLIDGSPSFPSDAKILKQTDDFMWISICNTDYIKKNILIYKYPIESVSEAMDPESILTHNMEVMNVNIPGPQENTYMTHSKFFRPTVEMINKGGRDIAEIRGLWDVENDYMGGPFMGHEFVSRDGKHMIGITGFVYAPKYDKIQYMRELEAIVYSFRFNGEEK
jgi:hypothetical protein